MISCIIPRSGRTFENFMKSIKYKCSNHNKIEIDEIVSIVKNGKKYKSSNIENVLAYLNKNNKNLKSISIFVDRKREKRPYRIGFLGKNFNFYNNSFLKLNEVKWSSFKKQLTLLDYQYYFDKFCNNHIVKVRIEGDEPHNCSTLVALDEADIALAGFDELLTTTQERLLLPDMVTKWGAYNYNLQKTRKVKIAGSAMLKIWNLTLNCYVQDIVGFFLISKTIPFQKKNYNYPKDHLKNLEKHRNIVYVKGRYADMVRLAYPKLNIESVEDVEDAVLDSESGAVGLEIVQSGSTLRKKGLFLLGEPLFLSESLYVVDYYKYNKKNTLKEFISILNPVGYYDNERVKQFALWFYALEKNLGDNWINKPQSIVKLFCEENEITHGLRPYRIQTRNWSPSDKYKLDEAYEVIEEAKSKLIHFYKELKKGNI